MEGVSEPDAVTDVLVREVIGAAIEVHKYLGPGFLETVYEEAMCVEMTLRGIPFERQKAINLEYKGHTIGVHGLTYSWAARSSWNSRR